MTIIAMVMIAMLMICIIISTKDFRMVRYFLHSCRVSFDCLTLVLIYFVPFAFYMQDVHIHIGKQAIKCVCVCTYVFCIYYFQKHKKAINT